MIDRNHIKARAAALRETKESEPARRPKGPTGDPMSASRRELLEFLESVRRIVEVIEECEAMRKSPGWPHPSPEWVADSHIAEMRSFATEALEKARSHQRILRRRVKTNGHAGGEYVHLLGELARVLATFERFLGEVDPEKAIDSGGGFTCFLRG
jgi:hypothetical protein